MVVRPVRVLVRAFRAETAEEAFASARYWAERLALPDRAKKINHISLVLSDHDPSVDPNAYRFTLAGTLSVAGHPADAAFRLDCWRDRACVFALRCDLVVETFDFGPNRARAGLTAR